ncbi:MAG: phospholipase D-like domain-containing protein [Deltaproteobacteria bacterium]|nr:phospholipase D-like domain-containing protein [Deltaproteobacteria bacterium]
MDGRVGYTGGVGFDDRWAGDADEINHWRETQVRVTGPVVPQLQKLFAENWERMTGEQLAGRDVFPPLDISGDVLAGVVGASKKEGWSNIREMFLLILAAARRTYYMNIAYFSPDPDSMRALSEAVERGVDVRIIVSGPDIDVPSSRYLAGKNYSRLLKAGVRIYEYMGTNMHAKTVVADGLFVTIGSSNFDNRTFNYNNESNLVVFDDNVAAAMEENLCRRS